MTVYEVRQTFLSSLDRLGSFDVPGLTDSEIDRCITYGIEDFIKTKLLGTGYSRQPVEATQKLVDDLSNLVETTEIPVLESTISKYSPEYKTTYFKLPENYWYSLHERAGFETYPCPRFYKVKECGVWVEREKPKIKKTCTIVARRHNDLNTILADRENCPYEELFIRFTLDGDVRFSSNAKNNNIVEIWHPANTDMFVYYLRYIKKYKEFKINVTYSKDTSSPMYYRDIEFWFNDHTHRDIIDLSVKRAAEILELPRVSTLPMTTTLQG